MATYRLTEGTLVIGAADADTDVAGRIAITSETATPAQPTDGRGYLYSKSDGKLYWRSYDVSETDLTAGGGSGAVSAVANGADNRITTFSGTDSLNGEANLTFDGSTLTLTGDMSVTGDAVTFASANSADPLIIIKNTTNDANGARLQFVKDKGAAGADGDDIGIIEFVGDDAGQTQTTFAKIVAEVSEADNTDEAGKLSLFVAESDGTTTTLTAGLILEGEHATDGEVDVTIGAGAASVVTVPGVLSVANDIILDDGGSIKEAGGTAAITIDASGHVTKIGQDSPTTGQYLKWDGSKAVWDGASAANKCAFMGYVSIQTSARSLSFNLQTSLGSAASNFRGFLVAPFAGSIAAVIVMIKTAGSEFTDANDGDVTVKVYKNQDNYATAGATVAADPDDFTEKVASIDGAGTEIMTKVYTPSVTFAQADLLQFTLEKENGSGRDAIVSVVLQES